MSQSRSMQGGEGEIVHMIPDREQMEFTSSALEPRTNTASLDTEPDNNTINDQNMRRGVRSVTTQITPRIIPPLQRSRNRNNIHDATRRPLQSRSTRNVATQMITRITPTLERPTDENDTHDASTQTVVQASRLERHMYETAIINAEPEEQPNSDDDIEVEANHGLGLNVIEEGMRRSEPPPILVEESNIRQPPLEPIPNCDPAPKRRDSPTHRTPPTAPPTSDVLIHVGGGWMRENHHLRHHHHLRGNYQSTLGLIPFVRSEFHPNHCKTPDVRKLRRRTDTIDFASFIP